MFGRLWPPDSDQTQHTDEVSDAQAQKQQQACAPAQQRGRLFAVVSSPVRLLGRGVGATASGVGSVVQKPVRAARHGFQRRDSIPEEEAQPMPEPEPAARRSPWDGLVENVRDNVKGGLESVKGSIEGAKELIPRGGEATSQQLLKRCFPARLSHAGGSGAAAFTGTTHDLAAAGTRLFGLSVGRAKLQVKIYEFAVYLDAKQAKASQLAKQHSFPAVSQPQASPGPAVSQPQRDDFSHSLRSANDIDMSLVVRASRNLPLRLMMGEYERILKRRLKVVGGSENDPALHQMLQGFSEDKLPEGMVRGGNVQKGSVLAFTRAPGGRITAAADGKELAAVTSPAFAAAVFDLYVGDQPVSDDARSTALDAAARMMAGGPDGYAPAPGQPGVCQGVGDGDACLAPRGRRRPWEGLLQPGKQPPQAPAPA